MNRSIAKTRNQLQRITLKINQLKTKYTGDISHQNLNVSGTQNNSPISVPHPQPQSLSNTTSQFKQYQQTKMRDRQPMVSGFQNKHVSVGLNKVSTLPTQMYGSEDTYQKQFKVFRNQIYNYIDKCISVNKDKQQQIIDTCIQSYLQKQKQTSKSGIGRNKNNLEQRIKKIQQETTNCLGSIQDAIVQIKKNEKHFNDKISNVESKSKKQIKQLSEQLKKILSDKETISNEELLKKIQGMQKQIYGLKQQLNKQSKKIFNFDESIEQIGIKIQNCENRINKKIHQTVSEHQQISSGKYEQLSEQIEKYQKFNIMIQKQILQLSMKLEELSNKQQPEHITEQQILGKVRQSIGGQIEQRISSLEETLQKNCTDLGSIGESILNIESRVQQILSSQVTIRQIVQIHEQKLQQMQSKYKNNEKSHQLLEYVEGKLRCMQKLHSQTNLKNKKEIMQQVSSLRLQIDSMIQQYIKPRLEQISQETVLKLNKSNQQNRQQILVDTQSSLLQKVNKLLGMLEQKINQKISDSQDRSRSVQEISEDMQQNLKSILMHQVQERVVDLLATYEQKRDHHSQSEGDGVLNSKIKQVQTRIKNSISKQIQLKMMNLEQIIQQSLKQKQTKKQDSKQYVKMRQQIMYEMTQKINELQSTTYLSVNQQIKTKMNALAQKLTQSLTQSLSQTFQQRIDNRMEDIRKQSAKEVSRQQEMSSLEDKLKQYVNAIIDNKMDEHNAFIGRTQTLDSEMLSQKQKSPSQKQQVQDLSEKRALEIVQQKLNQFQTDINQTIKLLYEDIENKVNQMLSHTGMMDFRADYEETKRKIQQLQSRIVQNFNMLNQSTHNLINNKADSVNQQPPSPILAIQHNNPTIQYQKQLQNIRSQIFTQMGNQIQKLSLILERTVQEMEMKVEKLDRNFSYIYERTSKIQFDNANFKDKLTYLLAERQIIKNSPMVQYRRSTPERALNNSNSNSFINTNTTSGNSNLLDVLGKFSTTSGTHFYQDN